MQGFKMLSVKWFQLKKNPIGKTATSLTDFIYTSKSWYDLFCLFASKISYVLFAQHLLLITTTIKKIAREVQHCVNVAVRGCRNTNNVKVTSIVAAVGRPTRLLIALLEVAANFGAKFRIAIRTKSARLWFLK